MVTNFESLFVSYNFGLALLTHNQEIQMKVVSLSKNYSSLYQQLIVMPVFYRRRRIKLECTRLVCRTNIVVIKKPLITSIFQKKPILNQTLCDYISTRVFFSGGYKNAHEDDDVIS